jgi:hypothetical protein
MDATEQAIKMIGEVRHTGIANLAANRQGPSRQMT